MLALRLPPLAPALFFFFFRKEACVFLYGDEMLFVHVRRLVCVNICSHGS